MRSARAVLMLLVLLPAGAAAQPEPEAARISSEQYIQELDSWIAYFRSIEKGEGTPRPADPPQEWIVTTTSGEFRVDPGFVRDALAGGAELNAGTEGSKPDRERVAGIAAGWLERMREGAEAHGQPAGSDLREQARAVLSRGEFRRVRAPGFKESVGDKINAALYKLLERIFGARGNLGNITTYVVWALVALAVIALGIWLARMMRTSDDDSLRLEGGPGGDAVSHRPWRTWLQEARVAAAAGDFREAVHLAYWAGIAALEESGAWKPDRARTPREYLRLLPAGREGHEPLGALTRDFERVWYAQQPAHPQDFAASLANLERLGCR